MKKSLIFIFASMIFFITCSTVALAQLSQITNIVVSSNDTMCLGDVTTIFRIRIVAPPNYDAKVASITLKSPVRIDSVLGSTAGVDTLFFAPTYNFGQGSNGYFLTSIIILKNDTAEIKIMARSNKVDTGALGLKIGSIQIIENGSVYTFKPPYPLQDGWPITKRIINWSCGVTYVYPPIVKIQAHQTKGCENQSFYIYEDINNNGIVKSKEWFVNGNSVGGFPPSQFYPGLNKVLCQVTDTFNRIIKDSVNIQVYPVIQPKFSGDIIFCPGGSTKARLDTNGLSSYFWKDSLGNISSSIEYQIFIAGTYSLTVTSKDGCIADTFFEVKNFKKAIAKWSGEKAVCLGGQGLINVDDTNLLNGWSWSNPNPTTKGPISQQVTALGVYTLYVQSLDGCFGETSISIQKAPADVEAKFFGDPSFCQGSFATFICDTTDLQAWSWYISQPVTKGQIELQVFSPGVQTLFVRSKNGCFNDTTFSVYEKPGQEKPVVYRNKKQLWADVNADSFVWYKENIPIPNTNESVFTPNESGNYSVKAINSFGCSGMSIPFYFDATIGIDEEKNRNVLIFTNSSARELIITNCPEKAIISLISINGKIVFKQSYGIKQYIHN